MRALLLLPLFAPAILAAADGPAYRVTLAPAEFERAAEVIVFQMPADAPKPAQLRDASGNTTPVQVGADGSATFFVAKQKANESLSYKIEPGPPASRATTDVALDQIPSQTNPVRTVAQANVPAQENPETAGVQVASEGGRLRFSVAGQNVFYFQMAKSAPTSVAAGIQRGGYLHPVFTPKGKLVTDDYPADHPHHHGIWAAWTETQFQGRTPDFWNMGKNQDNGMVEFVALGQTWSGPVQGGFEATLRSLDVSTKDKPVKVLDDSLRVTLYTAPGFTARVFDFIMTDTAATDDTLTLVEYRYGGLGIRGSSQWLDKANFNVLSSDGSTARSVSGGTPIRAKWYFLGGNVDGSPAGIVVLDDPKNFRDPTPLWMNPDQPFFCYAPPAGGPFEINKQTPYRARYRFLTMDGTADAKLIEAAWQGFAHPATATVEKS